MKITEKRLRKIVRNVISEGKDDNLHSIIEKLLDTGSGEEDMYMSGWQLYLFLTKKENALDSLSDDELKTACRWLGSVAKSQLKHRSLHK
tara:strand:+ start:1081 stop:1350 length:270 start_codon:yes stop_codon:yes gene_type:complete